MITYTLQDIEKKIAAYHELMMNCRRNGNIADLERFTIFYNSALKLKEKYFKENVKWIL